MDMLDLRLAVQGYNDACDDLLPKSGKLGQKHSRILIDTTAREMAEQEIRQHGRLVTSPRQIAKAAIGKTREFLSSRDDGSEEHVGRELVASSEHESAENSEGRASSRVAERREAINDSDEMSNAEYAGFFRNLSNRVSLPPSHDDDESED